MASRRAAVGQHVEAQMSTVRPDRPSPLARSASRPRPRPRPRPGAALALLLAVLLAACGGSTASGPAAASPSATAGSVIPADPCSVVSAADIEAAFGGTSTAARIDGDGNCSFDVSGTVHAGGTGESPATVRVSFAREHAAYDTQVAVLGDRVTRADGLGTDAWFMLGGLHAAVAGGELVIVGVWLDGYDQAIIQRDTIALAKVILARL